MARTYAGRGHLSDANGNVWDTTPTQSATLHSAGLRLSKSKPSTKSFLFVLLYVHSISYRSFTSAVPVSGRMYLSNFLALVFIYPSSNLPEFVKCHHSQLQNCPMSLVYCISHQNRYRRVQHIRRPRITLFSQL